MVLNQPIVVSDLATPACCERDLHFHDLTQKNHRNGTNVDRLTMSGDKKEAASPAKLVSACCGEDPE